MIEYYTTSEVADIFGVTAKTIRNWDADDSFIPERHDGENRMYSRTQIEEKLGKTIEESIDPIKSLTKENLNEFIGLCTDRLELDFNTMSGNTVKEKYQTLYLKIIEKSTAIYRRLEVSAANWLIASPEMSAWFETSTAGFAPAWMTNFSLPCAMNESESRITYMGVISHRWKLYATPMLEPDTMLLGVRIKNKLLQSPDSLALIRLKEWIS